jgi:acyl carrier protein phosphodiesterase
VQLGVKLHRLIDEYTDSHAIVLESKKRLRPKFRHYSPVIADVFYDHFLATDWANYSNQSLLTYTKEFYTLTEKFTDVLPEKAQYMLGYMKRDNWLFNYQYLEGIDRALTGMSRRTSFTSHMDEASVELKNNYEQYHDEFSRFFPELIAIAQDFLTSSHDK